MKAMICCLLLASTSVVGQTRTLSGVYTNAGRVAQNSVDTYTFKGNRVEISRKNPTGANQAYESTYKVEDGKVKISIGNDMYQILPIDKDGCLVQPDIQIPACKVDTAALLRDADFYREGKTQADADRDEAECRRAMVRREEGSIRSCMQKKGWRMR